MNKKFITFDIDETISKWDDNRDYENFVPYLEIINKINKLYNLGYHITLYTARGMRSMDGDIDRIERELKPPLLTWLKTNNVKYHKLIMGKPYWDIYIDDKNMTIDKFLNTRVSEI